MPLTPLSEAPGSEPLCTKKSADVFLGLKERPRTNVKIMKIFSAKNLAKKLAIFPKILLHSFCIKKLPKIGENRRK
jgi:hypothetical protein